MASGASYIAGDLADYLDEKGMAHVRGAIPTADPGQRPGPVAAGRPRKPCERALAPDPEPKDRDANDHVLLEHYVLPGDLGRQAGACVEYDNTRRYHESLGNLTPADASYGRGDQILQQQEEIKRKTLLARRSRHETENA